MLFLSILLGRVGTAQTIVDAHVLGIIPLGLDEYAVIQEDGTENYYETSPYPAGELVQSQAVQLEFNNGQTLQAEVIAASLNSTLFAQDIEQTDPPGATVPPSYTMPTVENGILFFNSTQHIAEVYDALTTFTENGDIDEQLDIIEATYTGFTSYRTWFNNEYNWLNGVLTLQQIDQITQENFIPDEIKKTLLNQDRFIGINDSVYYFHNLGCIMRVHKDNHEVLGHFEDIEREDEPLDSASNLPQHILEIDMIDGPTVLNDRGLVNVETPNEDSCWYVTRVYTQTPENCNSFLKSVQVYIVEYFKPDAGALDSVVYYNPSYSMELTVDWDDGTPYSFDSNYNYEYMTHEYDPYGTYNVKTTILFYDRYDNPHVIIDGDGSPGSIDIILTVAGACSKEDVVGITSAFDGNHHISCYTWINNNILGNHIGSATHLWKINGDGTAERVKGRIFTKVSGPLYNYLCEAKSFKAGDKLRNNQKKVQKVKSKIFQYYRFHEYEGIVSFHYFVKSGDAGDVAGHATPCP